MEEPLKNYDTKYDRPGDLMDETTRMVIHLSREHISNNLQTIHCIFDKISVSFPFQYLSISVVWDV